MELLGAYESDSQDSHEDAKGDHPVGSPPADQATLSIRWNTNAAVLKLMRKRAQNHQRENAASSIYNTVEERETAFRELLRDKGIISSDTWSRSVARIALDGRYSLLTSTAKKKRIFNEYVSSLRGSEPMIEEEDPMEVRVDTSWNTMQQQLRATLKGNVHYEALGYVERKLAFDEYISDLQKLVRALKRKEKIKERKLFQDFKSSEENSPCKTRKRSKPEHSSSRGPARDLRKREEVRRRERAKNDRRRRKRERMMKDTKESMIPRVESDKTLDKDTAERILKVERQAARRRRKKRQKKLKRQAGGGDDRRRRCFVSLEDDSPRADISESASPVRGAKRKDDHLRGSMGRCETKSPHSLPRKRPKLSHVRHRSSDSVNMSNTNGDSRTMDEDSFA
ncbi:hypothetical protein AAMO2058_000524700 [Amorphochlora amoebiformis]